VQLRIRFSRSVPVREINPAKGRFVCMVLDPDARSRRRVCVHRANGRLRATLSAIAADGTAEGAQRMLRAARIMVDDDVLQLRVPWSLLGVKPGPLVWHARVTWRGCLGPPGPGGCTQVFPESGGREMLIRPMRRPVPARRGSLRMLAAGDSMIQIIDSFLKQRLERRRATSVRSDAHISTGLSKPAGLNWVRRAREQAQSVHPDVTVMFIGANDGFSMKTRTGATVGCCGAGWVVEYARRVETMMRAYLRGGRSYVYWLTLPAPRGERFARVYRAVNDAIRRAGSRVGGGVRVIDLVPVFTPGGRFRQHVAFRGRTVNARQADGVHLSTAGASIVATLLIDRLRLDGALPPLR
jgi:lysophospholipase L1-like esterase